MQVAVTGATGYVGSRLTHRLADEGHEIVAIGRDHKTLPQRNRVRARAADVLDTAGLADAMRSCEVAYYLVHALSTGPNFTERDRDLAGSFREAAHMAGVRRIVYLGGLGQRDLSEHLASRQEVGRVLASGEVEVVELRAAVVLGSGSISFEMLRYLTERLPVMVCPRWIRTRIQPIAEGDLLDHLVRAADQAVPPGIYEVAGPEVTTYREMIASYARVRGLRRRRILDVPYLTPSLSAHWVDLVARVDRPTSHALIESLSTEVVAREIERTVRVLGPATTGVETAIRDALDGQADRLAAEVFDLPGGLRDGVFAMHEHVDVSDADVDEVCEGLRACGGDLRWYGLGPAWRLRMMLGWVFGERLELHKPAGLGVGSSVDWWTVAELGRCRLVLRTDDWFCGEAWLAYRVDRSDAARVEQVGALRPKGLLGLIYWRLLWPIHLVVFEVMAKRQATVKKDSRRAAARGRRARGAACP